MARGIRTQAFVALLCATILVPLVLSAEVTVPEEACPITDQVPITAEMRDEARIAGIPANQTCWNPQDKNIGLAAAEAKQYLRSILCANVRDNYGGEGPDATISKLNGGFAVCAATFLKAANARIPGGMPLLGGGTAPVCINEGFRTSAKQLEYWQRYRDPYKACDPTNKVCEHTAGLAIDVNTAPDSNYPLVWDLGSQYGVHFYLGWRDQFHFRAANTSCVSTATQFDLNTPVGGSAPTGGSISPATFDFPPQGVTPAPNPYATLAQQFAQLLGPLTQSFSQPNAPAAQPVTNPSIPLSSPVAPIANPLTTTTSNPTQTLSTETITNPLNVPTVSNPVTISTSGNVPTSSTLTIANPLSSGTAQSGSQKLSPLATIEMLAGLYPGGSTPTGASLSPAQVNDGLSNAASPDSGVRPMSASTTPISQTFTSSDLRYSPITRPAATPQNLEASRFSGLLNQLRTGLQSLLTTPLVPRGTIEIGVWTPISGYYNR